MEAPRARLAGDMEQPEASSQAKLEKRSRSSKRSELPETAEEVEVVEVYEPALPPAPKGPPPNALLGAAAFSLGGSAAGFA